MIWIVVDLKYLDLILICECEIQGSTKLEGSEKSFATAESSVERI